jgi:ATP-dependent DNA helicase RecG
MPKDIHRILGLPPEKVGPALLALREDQWYDRKSARVQAKDLANAIIGLANAEGGTIVIGLHGAIVEGVSRAGQRENDWRQASSDYIRPSVPTRFHQLECINEDGEQDALLTVDVEASHRVHTNSRDEAYLRIGDETRRLNFDQRRELEFDKGQSNYETTPVRIADPHLDPTLLADFAQRVGHPDPNRLLRARGLVARGGRSSVGALLLFGSNPLAEIPEAYVRILRYRGSDRGTGRRQQIIEDLRIEGPLPKQIRDGQQEIARLMPTRRALGYEGTFLNVGAVPRDAWLEGLVNAAVHRSYSLMGDHIRVEIFDDRVEIESPGRFPGIVDMSNPKEISRFARNPRIARVMSDLDFGQELGEGIRRMFEEMRLAGLAEPIYRQTSGSVHLTLLTEPVDKELEDRLSVNARAIVRVIRENGRASTGELAKLVRRSRPAVLHDLRTLEADGVIEWVGTKKKDPRAYWRLKL